MILIRTKQESPPPYPSRPDGRVARGTAAVAADPARPELSPLRRSARFARRAELLERRVESSFIAVGAVGLWQFHRDPAIVVIFLGIFLTGFGSAYYHWNPNDSTLIWDRLPITLGFMAILSVIVEERVSARAGAILLGRCSQSAYSACYCGAGPTICGSTPGCNFSPSLHCCCCCCCSRRNIPARTTGSSPRDSMRSPSARVLRPRGSFGRFHPERTYLKHLVAAAACFAILRYFQTRRPIA